MRRLLPVLAIAVLFLGLASVADAQDPGDPPLPPTQAWASATDEQVTLTWRGNPTNYYVPGYRIERSQGSLVDWETVEEFWPAENPFPWDDPLKTETYVDTDVLPSARYFYQIRSVNHHGPSRGYAGRSAETAVNPPGLSIFSGADRVTIRWEAPEDGSVTGYRILRRVEWGPEETPAADTGPGATVWVDRQVSPDTAYAYRLQALHGDRPGSRSGYIFALTTPVATPTVNVSEPEGQDLAAGTETIGLIEPGGRVTGTIESLKDRDWFAVDLEAGEGYYARLYLRYGPGEELVSPLRDPYGRVVVGCLQSADGSIVDGSGNCPYRGSKLFEVKRSGRYYITVDPRWNLWGLDESDMPVEYELELDHDVDLPQDSSLPRGHRALRTSSEVGLGTMVSGHLHNFDRRDLHRVDLCGGRWYRVPAFFDYGPEGDGVGRAGFAVHLSLFGAAAWRSHFRPSTTPFLFRASRTGTHYVNIIRDEDISTINPEEGSWEYRELAYKFMVEEVGGPPALANPTPVSEPAGGDLPADVATTGLALFSLPPDGSYVIGETETSNFVTDNIGSAGDRDWFRVRFDHETCEERVYWLELKGADTDEGTLEDPLIVGMYDALGNHIPFSHVAGQFQTWDNDSGFGRNAITDFTPPGQRYYFVEVAGFGDSTGTYKLSVTDITDTSTSLRADDHGEGFGYIGRFGSPIANQHFEDELVGNLVPGLPATLPAYKPRPEDPLLPPSVASARIFHLLRLGVEPNRKYRVEIRVPETSAGDPAKVTLLPVRAYKPYYDLGAEGSPGLDEFRFFSNEQHSIGDASFEFKAEPTTIVRGHTIPSRWHAQLDSYEEQTEPGDVYTMVLTDITDSGDDYLGGPQTTATVAVGGSATGNLEVDNDVDWFRVRMEGGKSYRIRMRGSESGGGTLSDPFVGVDDHGSSALTNFFSTVVTTNDDRSATEKDSELVVSPSSSFDGYIVAATPGTGTGTYTIEVEEAEVPGQAPQLVSYHVTSDPEHGADSDTYGLGDTITFEVEYDQEVTVAGDPQLRFSITGTPDEYADYVSGSGGATLIFSYTVQAGDNDTNGIYLYGPNLFNLDSDDEIKGALNNLAPEDPGQDPGTQSGHKVDGTIASMSQVANSPATGGPGIAGSPRTGETLTATTDGIEDEDGLSNPRFSYQWVRHDPAAVTDTDIDGETWAAYTVTAGDEGKALKVRVVFTDDAGNEETLTSYAVPVAPPALYPQSATVDGAVLTLTFNHTLDEGVSLPASVFTVTVAGAARDGERSVGVGLHRNPDPGLAGRCGRDGDGGLRQAGRTGFHPRHPRQPGGLLHRPGGREPDAGLLRTEGYGRTVHRCRLRSPGVPRRRGGVHLRAAAQRGAGGGLQLRDDAGPCFDGDGGRGDRRTAPGTGEQHPLEDNRAARLRQGRDGRAAAHYGLRRPGGHLHRRRQDALQRHLTAGTGSQHPGHRSPPPLVERHSRGRR